MSRTFRASLFCGSPVEVLLACDRFFPSMPDYAVLVLSWRVNRVESKVSALRCIDHIMPSARRDDYAVPVFDGCSTLSMITFPSPPSNRKN